jgi:hypothetical protein
MPINKVRERLTGIELLMPTAAVIAPGDLLLFGTGTHVLVGIANDGQNLTTKPIYYPNSGYLSLDCEGAFSLTVVAQTSKSPSAGAAITPGMQLYADGGTYDPVTGITYGSTIDADTNGTFIGLSEGSLAAGTTGTINVSLKGAA